jgi:hypothetical protein
MTRLSDLNLSSSDSLVDLGALADLPYPPDIVLDGCFNLDPTTVPPDLLDAVEPAVTAMFWYEHPDDRVDDTADMDDREESPPETGDDDYHYIYGLPDLGEAEPVEDYLGGWLVGRPEEIEPPALAGMSHDRWRDMNRCADAGSTLAATAPAGSELAGPEPDHEAVLLLRQTLRLGVRSALNGGSAELERLAEEVRASVLPAPVDTADWPTARHRTLQRANERF